ncbi:MAG: response regulator [Bacteroidales bacterium]|nr:response regulator [Candidatus Latescibacterota bacterium]
MNTYNDSLGVKNILVAEDDKDLRRLLQFDLESGGFKVSLAENGKVALDMIRENKPDCIILDVMMPVMDGFEACKRLKSINSTRDIPIIFLTARGATEDKVKAMGFEADDYMIKPFDFKELIARINLQISKKEMKSYDVEHASEKALKEVSERMSDKLAIPLDIIRRELLTLMEKSDGDLAAIESVRRCESSRRQIREVLADMQREINPFFDLEPEEEVVKL